MSNEVKQYGVSGPDWEVGEEPDGEFALWTDYAALEAKCEALQRLLDDVRGVRNADDVAQSAPVVPEGELPWTGEQLARAWYLAEYGPGHDLAPGYAVAFARELAAMLAAPQPAARQVCPACKGSGEGTDMGDPGEVACMCNGSGEIGADPAARQEQGDVVVTRNAAGQIVAVTRQDEEGRILSVIAEADPAGKGDEVRRLREALEEIRRADMNAPVSESNAGCIKRIKQIAERALSASAEGK